MKIAVSIIVALVSMIVVAQEKDIQNSLRARWQQMQSVTIARQEAEKAKFNNRYPAGTNELGLSFWENATYTNLLAQTVNNNPMKNVFSRTPAEQYLYERTLVVSSFMGFEFGSHFLRKEGERGCPVVKLPKPFRMFDEAQLQITQMDRICGVVLVKNTHYVSNEILDKEVGKLIALFERAYKIKFHEANKKCEISKAPNAKNYWFNNRHFGIHIYKRYITTDEDGYITVSMMQDKISEIDQAEKEREQKLQIERNKSAYDIPDDEGLELLIAPKK